MYVICFCFVLFLNYILGSFLSSAFDVDSSELGLCISQFGKYKYIVPDVKTK